MSPFVYFFCVMLLGTNLGLNGFGMTILLFSVRGRPTFMGF